MYCPESKTYDMQEVSPQRVNQVDRIHLLPELWPQELQSLEPNFSCRTHWWEFCQSLIHNMAVQSKIFTVSLFTFEMERAHRVIWCKACKCNGTREHGFRFFWDSTNNFAKCSIFMLGITCWFILDLCMIRFLFLFLFS